MSKHLQENHEITDESIRFAYRLLLNREPDPQAFEVKSSDNLQDLHTRITGSEEYRNHLVQQGRLEDLDENTPVTPTYRHWVWAWRVLLDRAPQKHEITPELLRAFHTTKDVRQHIMRSSEFNQKNSDYTVAKPCVVIKEIYNKLRVYVDLEDWQDSRRVAIDTIDYTPYIETFQSHLQDGDSVLDLEHGCGVFSVLMCHFVGHNGHVHSWDHAGKRTDLLARSIEENTFESRQTTHENPDRIWEKAFKMIRVESTKTFNQFQPFLMEQVQTHKAHLICPRGITLFHDLSSHRSRPFNKDLQFVEAYPWTT